MRILINLISLQDAPYENDYHYHLQSFFYKLMFEAGRKDIHERESYKHFCFSNIFPYEARFLNGSSYNLIFSTPDERLCFDLFAAIRARKESHPENSLVRIGKLAFKIVQVSKPFEIEIKSGDAVKARSATPIIVRIPSFRYKDYQINSIRPFEFWRDTISLESFVKQIRDGMEKRLLEIRGKSIVKLPEIISYRYIKSVSKPITVKGETQLTIGSIWEFEFSPQGMEEETNLSLSLDSGFGERNSLGFGFMNAI